MSAFYIFVLVASVFWVTSMAAGVVSIARSAMSASKPAWISIVSALYALLIGCLGMTHFHVMYSQTTNGVKRSIDSKWFFLVTVILGLIALALAIWRQTKSNRESQQSQKVQQNQVSNEPPKIS